MTDLDFESAQLELVTEALRAGPGSPQWRDALATLDSVTPGADEFKLLYAARERLASGRQYREVRAGAGFTRQVFDAIDQDAAEPTANAKALPSANLIAALSAAVILGILAIVAWLVVPRADDTTSAAGAGDDLSQTYFVNTLASTNFDGDGGDGIGSEFTTFGPLDVQTRSGLRPVLEGIADAKTFRGGGVVYARDLTADQPCAIDATVRLIKPADDPVVQVFVADERNFSADSATTAHELVWQARGADTSVYLPDGKVAASGPKVRPAGAGGAGGQSLDVRISVNRRQATVEVNGRRIWSGASQLDPTKPRIVGVRFLAGAAAKPADVPVVESVRVLSPQKQ
jgi:hypothetical protein